MKKWLILGTVISSFSALADFNSAMSAYQKKEYQTAYNEFEEMAHMGEKRSQFNLGVMYYQGQHVQSDLNKAYGWMKLALESENMTDREKQIFEIVRKEVDTAEAEKEYQKLQQEYGLEALYKKLYPIIRPEKTEGFAAKPLKIVQPNYPRKAAMAGWEGYTQFKLDLDQNGMPRNILLVDSFPADVFERESLKAIKRWRFEPQLNENNEPEYVKNMYYTLKYVLDGSKGETKESYVSFDNPVLKATKFKKPDVPNNDKELFKGRVEVNATFDINEVGKPVNIAYASTNNKDFQEEVEDVIEDWIFKNNTSLKNQKLTVVFKQQNKIAILPKKNILEEVKEKAEQGDYHNEWRYGLFLEKFPLLEGYGTQNEWYLKAALKGHPIAQYSLGENLMRGKGCVTDKQKGLEWLARAASNGQLDAKQKLGLIYADRKDIESQRLAREFLEDVVEKNPNERAKLRLANLLLESPFEEIRDPQRALQLAEDIRWIKIGDPITEYEIKAAASAAIGKLEDAVELQEEALEEAEDGGFYSSDIKSKLALYQSQLKSL
ncbi:TonB family protein [Pleionea sediminis]|uniref:TonB family protein n=1 Tax=Pleionea sediminis TaxID=2569479 RepID=UPI001186DD76|nr:TonB family protein [Pleionea sediminis]